MAVSWLKVASVLGITPKWTNKASQKERTVSIVIQSITSFGKLHVRRGYLFPGCQCYTTAWLLPCAMWSYTAITRTLACTKARDRRGRDDEHTFVEREKHFGLADSPTAPQWTGRRRSVEIACKTWEINRSMTLENSEYINPLHLHHGRKHRPAPISTRSASKTQPPLSNKPKPNPIANMKFSAFVVGLIGLTTVHGLATPNAAAGLQGTQGLALFPLSPDTNTLQSDKTA